MSKISIIVAMDEKRGIGKENALPWHIPEDLKRFKELTTGYPVVMGRKTYESIGKPLQRRTNIIVTRDKTYLATHPELDQGSTAMVVHELEEALEKAQEIDQEQVFVIGGGEIYNQALPLADRIYLTLVEGDFEAEVNFPKYENKFKVISETDWQESNGQKFKFIELEKN